MHHGPMSSADVRRPAAGPPRTANGAASLATALGLVGGLSWVAKFLVMLAQDGPEAGSVPENVTFFLGLVCLPLASGALGWHLSRGRSTGVRLLAVLGGVLVLAATLSLVQLGFRALPGDAWQQEEAVFVVLGAVVAAAAAAAVLRRRTR